ncbi:MAG: HAMP domain-containing histidine kinase [Vibrionaceae bacterium]|nr:HAMP domain-containing histidine kinase [Vibrionaceae bacterium]
MSLFIGLTFYFMFVFTIDWAEDEVGAKRIALDSNVAVERYLNGEEGKLTIDFMTDAYNDFDLVPPQYLKYTQGKRSFHGEVGEEGDSSRMLYIDEYQDNGVTKPIILISKIDDIELSDSEFDFILKIVLGVFACLMTVFTILLILLSNSLISPFNSLTKQFRQKDKNRHFSVSPHAALEFTQLTEQLNRHNQELVSLISREQAFSRYTSHELRTPLTVIKGASSLLQRQENSPFQVKQLTLINESANQMMSIVDALLSLVRYERDKEAAEFRLVTETELAKIIESNFRKTPLDEVSIELDVSGQPSINASHAVLNMVIGNLIRNAASACESGKITVKMSQDSISVMDEGIGFVDQPFEDGHGLGLILIADLCQRFCWQFTIQSEEDVGTVATISFQSNDTQPLN